MKTRLLFILLFIATTSLTFSQTTSIPDPNFEQALIDLGIDSDGIINGEVLTADVENVLTLDVQGKNISDLSGIEDFVSLTNLNCGDNLLTSVDLSQNTALIILVCYYNQFTSLDVTQLVDLEELNCESNQLTNLDVSQNINLTSLICTENQLNELIINQNTLLEKLLCDNNELTSIDVSQNILLTELVVTYNQLNEIDVSQNIELLHLRLTGNLFVEIDVTNNINLISLTAAVNQLTTVDVSQNTSLTSLSLAFNPLTNQDLSYNVELSTLQIYDTQITNIDLSQNSNLTWIYCFNTPIESLNIKNGNTQAITTMWCTDTPNLDCIQVDADIVDNIPVTWNYDAGVTFSDDCEYLGVSDNELSELSIYPNPTKGSLFVNSTNNDTIQSLQLYSTTGKLLLETKTAEIDLGNLPTGLYLLKIKTDNGISVKKVIKE